MKIPCLPVLDGFDADFDAQVEVSADLLSNLDQLELNIFHDYYSAFRHSVPDAFRVSAEEYLLGDQGRWGDSFLLCPEMLVARKWASSIHLVLPPRTAWTAEAVALIHAGRANCIAPVHFDWYHSWVAHACLTGRKRFFFFPPQAAWLLHPIINTSSIHIPRLSALDRQELIGCLGGCEIVLEAGQGVLFPSVYWHGVLYEDSSLSVSLRFECSPRGRPFAALPRSWLLQRMVWLFMKQGYGADADGFLWEYLRQFFQRRGGWRQRYNRVTSLCRRALLERGERKGAESLVGDNFSAELALASHELGFYYRDARRSGGLHNEELVVETFSYLFDGMQDVQVNLGMSLAGYALDVQQGLSPKRGLVKIKEQEDL